jgi:GAF domain-containing protein
MRIPEGRAALAAIWGLLAAFGALQGGIWIATGGIPRRPAVLAQVVAAWLVMLTLAAFASLRLGVLSNRLAQKDRAHRATLDEVEELQTRNAVLSIVARSVDVPLAFQALARRIARLIPCDRVGLALLTEHGDEFQTYTARTDEQERRARPRPEVMFKTERSALGAVVRSREPLIVDDTAAGAGEFLDVNVLHSAGFLSALVMPLVAKGRAVGTLNVVSRQRNAFDQHHVDVLVPIAELFAVTYVAQRLQVALGKYQTMEAMSELTISVSSEINDALQAIVGHCDLIERGYDNPELHRDMATIVRQAQRIEGLLAKMRAAAQDRLKEAAEGGVIASSPAAARDTEHT